MTALPSSNEALDLAKAVAESSGIAEDAIQDLSVYVALGYEHRSSVDLDIARQRLNLSENDVKIICMVPEFNSLVAVQRRDQETLFRAVCRDAAVSGAFILSDIISDSDVNPQIRVKATTVAIEQSGFDQRKSAENEAAASRFIVNINLEDPTKDVTISAPIIEHEGGTGL